MAVLGNTGRLELIREAPPACLIFPEDINNGSNSISNVCEGYWPGDHVVISGPPAGLPIIIDGEPQLIDGVASFVGGDLFVAPNRTQIADNTDTFYKTAAEQYPDGEFGDDANFYYIGPSDGSDTIRQIEGYICRDSLGRVRLYESRCEALQCCGDNLLQFSNEAGQRLDFDFITISPFGTSEYQNALLNCFGELGEYVFNDVAEDDQPFDPNRRVDSICNDPPLYLNPEAGTGEFDNADVQPRGNVNAPLWRIVCQVREWSLELDAPSVDTTGVGEKWGDAVKSLVSGGGKVDFYIDRKCMPDENEDAKVMMRLLLMTERGCKAHARFVLFSRQGECTDAGCHGLPGDLLYETDILITANAINLRPTEMVAATANFVTTGEIRLIEQA